MFFLKKVVPFFIFTASIFFMGCVSENLSVPETNLAQTLKNSPVRIQTDSGGLKIITLMDNAFQGRTSHLTPSMKKILWQIAQTMEQNPSLKLTISVYTDSHNNPKTNHLVSLRRAMMIADYFRNHGISSNRISTMGMGEKNAIANNSTGEGRIQNRRVEMILS